MDRRTILKSIFGGVFAPILPFNREDYNILKNIASPVIAKPRRLKTRWSVELEQDLLALHSIQLDEITAHMMSKEISKEIDEILRA